MFYIATAFSVMCMLALLVWAKPLAVLMGASGKGAILADGAAQYLRGVGIGFPPLVLAPLLSTVCQLDSAKARVRKSSIVYFVGNCSMDYAAVKLGLGVFGIGAASAIGMYLQLGYLLLHFCKKDRMLRFARFSTSFKEMFTTLSLGTEKALRRLGNFVSPVIVNRIVLFYGGKIAMSAFSVQTDLLNFAEIFAIGVADATALQSGILFGEINSEAIHAMGKTVHKYCFWLLGAIGAILIFLSKPIAGLYISEQGELFNMVMFASITAGLYTPLNGLVRSRISYLNSIKKTRNMQIMTLLSSVIYAVASAFALGILFGSYGILASDLLRVFLLLVTVWVFYAVKGKRFTPTKKEYLSLPDDFYMNPGDIISLDIKDKEDVSLSAEQIQLFCNGHKIDKKTGMKAALCFEELAVNIITWGFPKCKRKPSIDLRIVYSEDMLTIRLQDNCPRFDVEWYIAQEINNSISEEEDTRLGLQLIGSLVDDIRYVHSLDTNNVIIKFPLSTNSDK